MIFILAMFYYVPSVSGSFGFFLKPLMFSIPTFYFILISFPYLSSLQLQTYLLMYSYIFFPYNAPLIIDRPPHYHLHSYKLLILKIPLVLFNPLCYVLFIVALIFSYSLFSIYYYFLKLPVLAAAPDSISCHSLSF